MKAVRTYGKREAWIEFFVTGVHHQAEESLLRSQELHTVQQEYEPEYGNNAAAYAQLACTLLEQPYLTAAVVKELLDVTGPTASLRFESLVEKTDISPHPSSLE